MNELERKNRTVGMLTSAGIHSLLFLLLFFIIAWRAPDPPLPEYGIELNFGLDNAGGGDIQPDRPVGENGEMTTPATDQKVNDEAKEANVAEVKELVVASKAESSVIVKEDKRKEAMGKEVKADESLPNEAITEYKKEAIKPATPADTEKKGEQRSQGDDANKQGDKGSPDGKLDASALYGTPGGGGGGTGMNLQMSGWAWADQPATPEIPDNANGRVVFEIECDEKGDIIGITTLERSLSPRAEQLLKEMIRKNSLVRTSGAKVPDRSKGRIVFVLKTK